MAVPPSVDSSSLKEANFRYVCELAEREAAIVLGAGKEYLVETRLGVLASKHKLASVNAFIDHVRFSPIQSALHREIIDALTTNETLFFRDFHPFEALRKEVLPGLLSRTREGRICIWSAACSSGQEPYSIAMTLLEHFPDQAHRFEIIGTDISTAILHRARTAVYPQLEVNRGLPAPLLVKYFSQTPEGWRLNDKVRSMVSFREINLARSFAHMPRCHLVFLRNVMIYFDLSVRRQILSQVRSLLHPEGLLVLGGAETTLMVDDSFLPVTYGRSTFYRTQ